MPGILDFFGPDLSNSQVIGSPLTSPPPWFKKRVGWTQRACLAQADGCIKCTQYIVNKIYDIYICKINPMYLYPYTAYMAHAKLIKFYDMYNNLNSN